ncbi:BCD family MFS transporter [Kallotenue papyrolyticum]|uniref:BCD family MFS transporter n=1 Tax=Kallotenue papyrolyticum TaxID=1325125 RepID=UPI00047859E0|nr:BCD family MFS transporter [Kallotenue papyrolyticum]
MVLIRSIRLGLLHVVAAITLVPITGVLNRLMIHEFGILATVVAALVIAPYLLSPLQIWIGQYSDSHPLWGYRRTPYIALGLLLTVGGALLTPHAALLMEHAFGPGLLLATLAFGLWGMGFNIATVAYLALASDLSSPEQRPRTVAVMWFMMISSVIVTALLLGRALHDYTPARLIQVFNLLGGCALLLAALGLIGLEPRSRQLRPQTRHSQRAAVRAVLHHPQARLFFIYLTLLLAAILGQDVLLEPFGAQAFAMPVSQTTRLTSLWGSALLLALLLEGFVISRLLSKKASAALGSTVAAGGLLLIAASGMLRLEALFLPGVFALGFGTGISTAANLALMLDMTLPEQAGLFIGAWGVADALARGMGMLLAGVVRDLVTALTGNATDGYVMVFLLEAGLLAISLALLPRLDVRAFRTRQPTLAELAALSGETL